MKPEQHHAIIEKTSIVRVDYMNDAVKLDKNDLSILRELQKNARITNQDLAAKVGISPSSCLNKVRRLETENILVSYHAKVNLPMVCRHLVCIATVSLKNHLEADFRAFEELVSSIPEIVECFTVSGEFDYFLKIICPDMPKYLEINDELVNSRDYSISIKTHVVMSEGKSQAVVDLNSLLDDG